DQGASVAVADLTPPHVVAQAIAARGGSSLALAVDVTDRATTDAMAAATVDAFGRLDVLVNNAGFFRSAQRGHFAEIPTEECDSAFAVNVRGPWQCGQSAAPHMRTNQSGRIINVGSNTGFRGVPQSLHYVAPQSALIGLTRGLA